MMTNKEIGIKALGKAINFFVNNDYTVSIPLNDTQDYDLIVDKGRLFKVQVKGTRQLNKSKLSKIPIVTLESMGGRVGKVYKTVIDTSVDLLYVYSFATFQQWLIPVSQITSRATLNLDKKYAEFLI